jgi:hypothetical protein
MRTHGCAVSRICRAISNFLIHKAGLTQAQHK